MKLQFLLLLSFFSFSILNAQFVQGKVLDQTGEPLSNAEVLILENNTLSYTDQAGEFNFDTGVVGDVTIRVSYLGYRSQDISATTKPQTVMRLETIRMIQSAFKIKSLTISATRNQDTEPFTYENYDREYIEDLNLGQDVPFVLNFTPSVVSTSDAGAGIGYTGLRIRGSDPSRVNVTINGIPYNDSESLQVFWVNLPDFASSLEDIQVQRGVGTSTNGAGAFGATINMNTFSQSDDAYAELNNTFGSFNTRRHTLKLGTGWVNDHWNFDARLSTIKSDGYINRASSDLNSYYLNGSYRYDKGFIRAVVFTGHEITYQSWFGTPEAVVNEDLAGTQDYCARNGVSDAECERLIREGRRYNFYTYENQVDNYRQDHYQLHFNHAVNNELSLSAAGHYTYGRGYFEQFRADDDYADYGLDNPVVNDLEIFSSDIIRRRWLDNHFYGFNTNMQWTPEDATLQLGLAWNNYEGDHFGRIIRGDFIPDIGTPNQYYFNLGEKEDMSTFAKLDYALSDQLNAFGDIQYRRVNYEVNGNDNDLVDIAVDTLMSFFNPKLGLSYQMDDQANIYGSIAVAHKEPDRNDFVDARPGQVPKAERLTNLELGVRRQDEKSRLNANIYYMLYKDQLVLTGALNDVGAPLKTNVDQSYRLGVELDYTYRFTERFSLTGNATLSRNRIAAFNEVIEDYTDGFDLVVNPIEDTDISFSPNTIAALIASWSPINDLTASWYMKHVGQQYLDNTSNPDRQLDAYTVHNLQLQYQLESRFGADFAFNFMLNNVLGTKYSANGYTFSYIVGDLITENFLYPQAERNFLLGVNISLQ